MTEPGTSFGVAAEAYERGRPEWPEELLDALPLAPDAEVLDLGAGTGKLTRLLARRYRRVVAVEPDAGMRALNPGAVDGRAEAIPLPDAAVDAVFCAEAFHWFDQARAVPEIRRVLRPDGVLALLRNDYDPATDVLPKELQWPTRSRTDDSPLREGTEVRIPRERDVPREELLNYFASISQVTSLPAQERAEWLRRLAIALDRPGYRRRWTAVLHWTRRP